ncbi:MAG: hypothetical protein N2510_07055 [Ignavibacteria bacterium]|nr:hypothetical protein [Ignavibacteria bacterium]
MLNSIKYIVKTDNEKIYVLHIFECSEYQEKKYIGLFLYYDDEEINGVWQHLRHRVLFENSVEDIKDKVIEYTEGRNEHVVFLPDLQHAA